MSSLFITGTDTDVGKTFITEALLEELTARRHTCIGFKPVSAGCDETEQGLRNSDAVKLQKLTSFDLPYDLINPVAFKEPVAPHIAAAKLGQSIDGQVIESTYQELLKHNADYVLIEGAGGWRVPISHNTFLSDFAIAHKFKVVMVVGVKLGCLNHARITAEAIRNDGLELAGWVANHVDTEMRFLEENIHALHELLEAPFLGEVPLVPNPSVARRYLDVTPLLP